MPDLPVDLEALLSPLADANPAGPNLDLDPAFQALEQGATGKPERQYGAKVYPAEPPDWPAMQQHALALAARTRDLRVAVWLLRSAAHLQGLPGVATGLELLHELLRRHWDAVHPQLDPSDDASEGSDPTMRLNALAPLANRDAALADLRAAALANERGSLSLRELELGLGQEPAGPGEVAPTAAGVLKALGELSQRHPALAQTAARGSAALAGINAVLHERLGAAHAPDLSAFTQLWVLLGRGLAGGAAPPGTTSNLAAAPAAGELPAPTAASAANALNNRADAQRELERVCSWLETHEPSHPAPLLIRRAQRLIGMSFIEIIRDLAPDGLSQVERVAGSPASS